MDSKVSFTGHIDVTVGKALAEEKKKPSHLPRILFYEWGSDCFDNGVTGILIRH
jgi:hypothetical protein